MHRRSTWKLAALVVSTTALSWPVLAQDEPSVFTMAYPTSFPDLDPSTSFSNDSAIMGNVYEPLVWLEPGTAEAAGGLKPGLATSWEASDDGKTWTFHLRPDVKFHDGTRFDSAAVKFSIERTKTINGGAAFIWGPVESIETPDPMTVVFHLSYAAPLDLIASSGYAAWMMSPSAADKDAAWFNQGRDLGTGPYRIRSYQPGQQAVLEQVADYWGGWSDGAFTHVVLDVVEDPTLRQQKIEAGEADWTMDLPTENLAGLAENPELSVVVNPAYQNLFGLLNVRRPPLDDARVRQAISYAFPYGDFVDGAMQGYATQARGIIPAGMEGYDPEAMQYGYDLEKARALLAEAGHPDGGFSLTMTYATGNAVEETAGELWKASLAELGIDLELQPMAWEAQWELAKSDSAAAQDVFVMYWWPTYVTAYDFLFNLFHSEETPSFNLGYYGNPAFDALIDEGNSISATDRAAAVAKYQEAQRLLIADAAAVFLFDQQNIHVIRRDVAGYVDNPGYAHIVFVHELSRTGS